MASYTIYYPLPANCGFLPPNAKLDGCFCTFILADTIKNALIENGDEANISYFHLYEEEKRLAIKDLSIDLTNEHSKISDTMWMIFANNDTKKFVVIDLQDGPAITHQIQSHENYVMSLIAQCSFERYRSKDPFNPYLDLTRIVPFVYSAYSPILTENMIGEIQEVRNSLEKLDNRILFFGNNQDSYVNYGKKIREVITVLEQKYPDEVCVGSTEKKLPLLDFFKKAASHKINLALPGHQWCSREHELWTLGLPVMMYEHTHHTAVELIPNYHYIAVPGGERMDIGMANDPEVAADNIIAAHRKWITPDYEWRLNAIAKNGQDRILQQANFRNTIIPKLFKLLQLGKW